MTAKHARLLIALALGASVAGCDWWRQNVEPVGRAIGAGARETGSAIGSAARNTGSAIGEAARGTGSAVGKAARGTGDAIGEGVHDTGAAIKGATSSRRDSNWVDPAPTQ